MEEVCVEVIKGKNEEMTSYHDGSFPHISCDWVPLKLSACVLTTYCVASLTLTLTECVDACQKASEFLHKTRGSVNKTTLHKLSKCQVDSTCVMIHFDSSLNKIRKRLISANIFILNIHFMGIKIMCNKRFPCS